MKRAKTRGTSAAKAKAGPKNVEEYVAGVPESARHRLAEMRSVIRSVVPAESTEVISYGIPAFRHNGIIVWYAAFSDHCSLFPTAAVIGRFKKELEGFRTSKGTIHFPLDKPLPTALIKKMVKTRVAESKSKKSR